MSSVKKLLDVTHRRRFTEEEISDIITYNGTMEGEELWEIFTPVYWKIGDPLACWAVFGDHGSLCYPTNKKVFLVNAQGVTRSFKDLGHAMSSWEKGK